MSLLKFPPIRKVRSAIIRASAAAERLRDWHGRRKKLRALEMWLNRINKTAPDVLVGANFVDLGGTRNHMHCIEQYSSLKVMLAPDETVMRQLQPYEVCSLLGDRFSTFIPRATHILHSHVFPWFIEWCEKRKRENDFRWIHTHHNWYYPEFGREGLEPWQLQFNEAFLFALKNADACISVSRWQKRFLEESFGLQTHYIPNGVDVAACQRGVARDWHAQVGNDKPFVLYVGRNDPVKNPALFAKLAGCMPDQQFIMAGQGLSTAVMIDEWNVVCPNNLRILGQLQHQQVQNALAACRVLVVTSRREGLPTLVLEALALGKPVVVPEEDGCMEAIDHGRFGFHFRQDDLTDCSRALTHALQEPINIEAQQRVREEFDWPVILRKLDRVYLGASPAIV